MLKEQRSKKYFTQIFNIILYILLYFYIVVYLMIASDRQLQ